MVLNDCYIHVLWNGGCLKFTVIPLYFRVLFCEWREQEKVIEGEIMSWGGEGCFPVPTHTYNWTPLAVCYYWKQLIGVVYCNWTGTGYMILSDYPVEDDIDTHPTSETKEKEVPHWRKVGWIGSLNGNARIHHTHTHMVVYWVSRERKGQSEWVIISLLINGFVNKPSRWDCLQISLGNMVS